MESEGPRVHKSPSLDQILGCFSTVHTSTSCSLRVFNMPHIHPSALLFPRFQTPFLCTHYILLRVLHVTPFLLPWYDDPMEISGAYHKLWMSLSCNFLCPSLNLRSNVVLYYPQQFLLNHPQSMFLPWSAKPSTTPINNSRCFNDTGKTRHVSRLLIKDIKVLHNTSRIKGGRINYANPKPSSGSKNRRLTLRRPAS